MENPNLTFVTPALLAGDRSMSNVIGHEISHSWTGNLVTNKNWANFWVNEGFTKFMERKLDKELLGEEMAKLESIVGKNSLISAIKMVGDKEADEKNSTSFRKLNMKEGSSTVLIYCCVTVSPLRIRAVSASSALLITRRHRVLLP